MLAETTIKDASVEYLNEVASSNLSPGTSSLSALVGALGVSLLSAACQSSIEENNHPMNAKDPYIAQGTRGTWVAKEGRGCHPPRELLLMDLTHIEVLREDLRKLLTADLYAKHTLQAALEMPSRTEEQTRQRASAIQGALITIIAIPLAVAQDCRKALDLAKQTARYGNPQAIKDVAASVMLCEAALQSALLSAQTYLEQVDDPSLTTDVRRLIDEHKRGFVEHKSQVLAIVENRVHTDPPSAYQVRGQSRII